VPINSLPYRAFNELANSFKAKGRPRRGGREDFKDILQQHGSTINDATRQARAIILKIPHHQLRRGQQHLLYPVTE
jgi:hypothetical protein